MLAEPQRPPWLLDLTGLGFVVALSVVPHCTLSCSALEKDVSCQEETQESVLMKSYIF